jgi:hypothetical protein
MAVEYFVFGTFLVWVGNATAIPADVSFKKKKKSKGPNTKQNAEVCLLDRLLIPVNSLDCKKSRRNASEFFQKNRLPIARRTFAGGLIGGEEECHDRYCSAKLGQIDVANHASGGQTEIDLSGVPGIYLSFRWYNPRTGGELIEDRKILGRAARILDELPTDKAEDRVARIQAD